VTEGYHPITSPISEVGDKVLGPSQIQKYWTRSQTHHNKRGRRRAMIRPLQLVNGRYVTVRRNYRPRLFRLGITAPVIQTNTVIAKVTLADGTSSRETLDHRIFMARHAQTQTYLLRQHLSRSTMYQISIPGRIMEELVDISSGEENKEEEVSPVIVVEESGGEEQEASGEGQVESEKEGEAGITSPGTPLQDE
jgi:hypothetical protein